MIEYSSKKEYQRSSISRFYYNCFGPSKEYYEKAFRRILSTKDAHKILIEDLKNSPFIEEHLLGEKLKKLRSQRNRADYNSKSQNFDAEKSKRLVEDIFSMLNNFKNNPIRVMKKK